MARLNSADELEALRRQQIELAKRIKEVEVKTRLKEKADNERREQIAGRAVIAYLATNPQSEISKAIVAVLETGIIKPAERALFFGAAAAPTTAAAAQGNKRPEEKHPEDRAPEQREPFAAAPLESGKAYADGLVFIPDTQ